MSEFRVQCVKLDKFAKHPNAETLSIISIEGRPVIFKTDDFPQSSYAVHIPTDALVDTARPEFQWLAGDKVPGGIHRVKFKKLRGIPSYGFLTPVAVESGEAAQAINWQERFGITKYEPEMAANAQGTHAGGQIGIYYDIESLHKYKTILEGVRVQVTEKIHGQQGKWMVDTAGELHSSSRNHARRDSVWNRMGDKYQLSRLPPGVVLYGEVYGPGCQDLTYGVKEPSVVFFDAYDVTTGQFYDVSEFGKLLTGLGLPGAPIVYTGVFDIDVFRALAEDKSTLNYLNGNANAQVGEGIVVKPLAEMYDQNIGRVFLKLVGKGIFSGKAANIMDLEDIIYLAEKEAESRWLDYRDRGEDPDDRYYAEVADETLAWLKSLRS